MAYEMHDNEGSLFRNDKKDTDKHPDYKGQAMIGGVEYWVSAWINETKTGTKYMKFKYQAKDDARKEPIPRAEHDKNARALDDEIPF